MVNSLLHSNHFELVDVLGSLDAHDSRFSLCTSVLVFQVANKLMNLVAASAIDIIKSSMNLVDWSGDPCLPTPYSWLTCENNDSSPDILAV
jgi:hypothetical protein